MQASNQFIQGLPSSNKDVPTCLVVLSPGCFLLGSAQGALYLIRDGVFIARFPSFSPVRKLAVLKDEVLVLHGDVLEVVLKLDLVKNSKMKRRVLKKGLVVDLFALNQSGSMEMYVGRL